MNDYYTYSQNILPGGLARSEPIVEQFNALQQAFAFLPSKVALYQGVWTHAEASGNGQAYLATLPYSLDAYANGMLVTFIAPASNTGPATININNAGAVAIRRVNGQPLAASDFAYHEIVTLRYNASKGWFELSAMTANMATEEVSAIVDQGVSDIEQIKSSGITDAQSIVDQASADFDTQITSVTQMVVLADQRATTAQQSVTEAGQARDIATQAANDAQGSASSAATQAANVGAMLGINFGGWQIVDGELIVSHLSTTTPSLSDGDLILDYEELEAI